MISSSIISTFAPRLLVAIVFCVAGLLPAAAQDAPWKVSGKLLGKAKGPSGFEKSEDVSGIACVPGTILPRLCLIADDETQGVQIVLLKEGELIAGDFIGLTDAQYEGKPLELDAEGVAYEDGSFYVIGSHGRARHEQSAAKEEKNNAKAAAARQIFRIGLPVSAVDMTTGKLLARPAITPSLRLADILGRHTKIAPWYDKALADNGLTIEGIAARDKRLYLGMRGPVLGTDAVVISVAASALFDAEQSDAKSYELALEKDTRGMARGIRDITPYGNGFLVLAGPVNDPPDDKIETGDYAIYSWDGANKPERRLDLKSYGKKVKPEALLPLDGDAGRVRVLVMFDGPKEGSPRPIEMKLR